MGRPVCGFATAVHAGLLLYLVRSCTCQTDLQGPGLAPTGAPTPHLSSAPAPAPSSAVVSGVAPAPSPVPGVTPSIFPVLPGSFRTAASNAAVDWNIATQWVLRTGNATNLASRVFALTSLGIWQALKANENQTEPADPTAVAAYAAHNLLINQFPVYFALYDQLLLRELDGVSEDEQDKARAIAYPVVVKLLASRLDDGFQDPQRGPPTNAAPGQFKDVGSGAFRALQQFANTRPLLLPADLSTVDFITNFTAPPSLDSNAYNTELTATLLLGSNTSTVRTADQTVTSLFWSDGGTGTTGIPGHWNQLILATMPENITLLQSAEILAKMNVAMYDATIVIFYLKYYFNRWRPITAIRSPLLTGDDVHTAIRDWTPLLLTPNNPTYPSAQGGYAGAGEILLSEFYGRDNYIFNLGTEVQRPGVFIQSRIYRSFSFVASEVTQSRYFGGIENPADAKAGRVIGQYVAQYILDYFEEEFTPV